jgi:hypothetical protein
MWSGRFEAVTRCRAVEVGGWRIEDAGPNGEEFDSSRRLGTTASSSSLLYSSRIAKARSMIDPRLFMDLEERLEPPGAVVHERRPPLEASESLSSLSGAELLDSCWSCLCTRSSSPRLGADALANGSELFEKVMVSGSLRCLKIRSIRLGSIL